MSECTCPETYNRLIKSISNHGYDAYLLTNTDIYFNEFIAEKSKLIEHFCSFTGSTMTAIFHKEKSLAILDGRYIEQGQKQLCSNHWKCILYDRSSPFTVFDNTYGGKIAVDPFLLTSASYDKIKTLSLVKTEVVLHYKKEPFGRDNLACNILKEHKHSIKSLAAETQVQVKYLTDAEAGEARYAKHKKLCLTYDLDETRYFFCNNLDEVSWFLNVRANSLPYCGVLEASLIITKSKIDIYTDVNLDISKLLQSYKTDDSNFQINKFAADKVISNFAELYPKLKWIYADESVSTGLKMIFSQKKFNFYKVNSPIAKWMSIKNITEQDASKNLHAVDGLAITMLIYLVKTHGNLSENLVSTMLKEVRSFLGLKKESFKTIAARGAHSSQIHYDTPTNDLASNNETEDAQVEATEEDYNSLFLLDCGVHSALATTDCTRTFLTNFATDCTNIELKKWYTKVLAAHIDLSDIKFPKDWVRGSELDAIARQHFWNDCTDYRHGTGHGVGAGTVVHQSPPSICFGATKPSDNNFLEPGQIVSNEPGYYVDGKFGIRIENLQIVKPVVRNLDFLLFETLTLVPYEHSLININLLNRAQIKWLNTYHTLVYNKLMIRFFDFSHRFETESDFAATCPVYLQSLLQTNGTHSNEFVVWLKEQCGAHS